MEGFMIDQNMDLLTVNDLARQLRVKPSWIYGETRKTGKGSIPRIRVGKYLRFRLEEVMDWLKAHQEN
jgi:excisionase family DNA binding protein